MLAALSGAPVLPVYVQGSGRALPKGAALPRPARVTVAFGDPIRFGKTRGRTRYQDVSDEIMAAIGRLKAEAEGRHPAAAGVTRTDPTTPGRTLAGRIH
jgi:1-acyl-sn-glycerol-3-phosphate acyltransferase